MSILSLPVLSRFTRGAIGATDAKMSKLKPSKTPPRRKSASNLFKMIQNDQFWHPCSIWIHREQGNRVFTSKST